MVWPNVDQFADGVSVLDAETLNGPIAQLVERTEYLKNLLDGMGGRTNITVANVELQGERVTVDGSPTTVYPSLGQPVYRVAGGNAYAKAAAIVGDVSESKWFWADQQAMAVGVVGSTPSGSTATVVLSGYVKFGEVGSGDTATTGIPVANVIADANPTSGRYFLSATAGKLTAAPSGPIIYVCDCQIVDGMVVSMLVNPQYRDTGESHVHRSFVLSGTPMGGYLSVDAGPDPAEYRISRIPPADIPLADRSKHLLLLLYGQWTGGGASYTLVVRRKSGTSGSANWGDYAIDWTSAADEDGGGSVSLANLASYDSIRADVGSRGLKILVHRPANVGSPADLVDDTWTLDMPYAGQDWVPSWTPAGTGWVGFKLNLGMYPEMARFVPPLPANGAALIMDGLELRGAEFGDAKRWDIAPADDNGGPWLRWYGGQVDGDNTDMPFVFVNANTAATPRRLVLHVNRMRVGPTGFVTSLQAAPGSPLKVTSAQTGATAAQGALQVGLAIDFKSRAGGAEGHEVVKRIEGEEFITGPVVERVVAGPGMAVNREQGVVTVSASNAVYAGDFETIALRNAKQDLAGGVFPYTKLLRWNTGGTNIDSGFTAKFRVPDYIPYNAGKGYYVVVSASVFGEEASASAASAAFGLTGYYLADQACSPDVSGTFTGSVANPAGGYAQVIDVPFADAYAAFDPVLVHGFRNSVDGAGPGTLVLPDTPAGAQVQRSRRDGLWLLASASAHMVVYPGYFVGLSIERCGLPENSTATPYVPAIGFLSLRWNLVPVS